MSRCIICFRPHFEFLEDCLQAHVTAAAKITLELMGIKDTEVQQLRGIEAQRDFIHKISSDILEQFVKPGNSILL